MNLAIFALIVCSCAIMFFNQDDSSELTEDGVALIEIGDDHQSILIVSLLKNFEGDLLAGIGQNWNIFLKFLY